MLSDFSGFQSLISIQRPFVKIIKDDGSILDPKAKQTAPDQIMIHGMLKSGTQVGTPADFSCDYAKPSVLRLPVCFITFTAKVLKIVANGMP